VDHYTEVRAEKETEILAVLERRLTAAGARLSLGRLKVTERIHGYVKKSLRGGQVLSEHPLEAPPLVFETEGFWVALPPGLEGACARKGLHFMGGIHAFEHALIGIFPLRALSDRWDLGGISYPHHPQVEGPAVFVYDGYPGGVGLSRKGYALFEELLQATVLLLRDCPCEGGCPACVQSPKCGSGNKPLDKAGARLTAEVLAGLAEAEPAPGPPEARLPEARARAEKGRRKAPPGRLVFDLETQRLAAEVGGWGKIRSMGLALAVTWDLDRDRFRTYFEEEAEDLVRDLLQAPLVVGFNLRRFDLEVLSPYTHEDLSRVKTLDLLEFLKKRLGVRLSLASLAEANFGEGKEADGVQSVAWFREGRFDLIESYCRKDVLLTGRLFLRGLEEGFILVRDRSGTLLRVPVNRWGLPEAP
jgi:DEAD/DEAH box helicase domain-containing protein